jgi:hypothetical protein
MVQYKPNDPDQIIIATITNRIRASLREWYGQEARLHSATPEIRTYQYCFMLRYALSVSATRQKAILVKIRRNPKMDALHQAIQSDIHQVMPLEYKTLEYLYENLAHASPDFGAIRPLIFLEKYFAILMEEFPSRTMTQLMIAQRSSPTDWSLSELKDAARKTGRWLYYFHHRLNHSHERPYTSAAILEEAREFAERIESVSRGRVRAQPLLDLFAGKLEDIPIKRMKFSQTHSDMTTNNVLYSEEEKVCIIDMKDRLAPVYVDLGLILTYPETSKPQIFSAGRYYPETLLRNYRAEILAGYFEQEPGDEILARIYAAVKVLDKWRMYEELMARYKGMKHVLSIPAAPLISAYFQNLLKKHLALIGKPESGQLFAKESTSIDTSL